MVRKNRSAGNLRRTQSGSLRVIHEGQPSYVEPEPQACRILCAFPGSPSSQQQPRLRQNGTDLSCHTTYHPADVTPANGAACGVHECSREYLSNDQPGFPETSERKQHGARRALDLLRSSSSGSLGTAAAFAGEVAGRLRATRAFSASEGDLASSVACPSAFWNASERVVRGSSSALDLLSMDEDDLSEFMSSDGESVSFGATSMSTTPGSSF